MQKQSGWIIDHMRSSKSRSRNKNNRNNRPTGGNIVNRVFDSSGPDGKVRGTPQQIIEKYLQLHRDAQLSNDRVNAENFAQHAEHYLRMLAEAQREIDKNRDEQEREVRDRQAERDRDRERQAEREPREQRESREPREPREQRDRPQRSRDQEGGGSPESDTSPGTDTRSKPGSDSNRAEAGQSSFGEMPGSVPAFLSAPQPDEASEEGSGLVETPEAAAETAPRRPRRPRKPKAASADSGSNDPAGTENGGTGRAGPAEAAE